MKYTGTFIGLVLLILALYMIPNEHEHKHFWVPYNQFEAYQVTLCMTTQTQIVPSDSTHQETKTSRKYFEQ